MARKKVHDKCCLWPAMECNPDACAYYAQCAHEKVENMMAAYRHIAMFEKFFNQVGGDEY